MTHLWSRCRSLSCTCPPPINFTCRDVNKTSNRHSRACNYWFNSAARQCFQEISILQERFVPRTNLLDGCCCCCRLHPFPTPAFYPQCVVQASHVPRLPRPQKHKEATLYSCPGNDQLVPVSNDVVGDCRVFCHKNKMWDIKLFILKQGIINARTIL